MTRWVTRSVISSVVMSVAVTIALAGAATAATATATATATTARTAAASLGTSVPVAAALGSHRPVGDVVVAMLRLAGVRTCVDWRQGVTSNLRPCQATPSGAALTTAGYGTGSASTVTAPAGVNLAAGRPAVASSALLGSPAAHAVDDSLDTAWRTRGADAWWAVDLGRATSLSAVVLNWDGGELPSGFSLLTSSDGDRWKRVGKAHGRPNGGPTVLQAAVKARFVRVNVDGPASSAVALRDVRAFAPAVAPPDKRASRDRRDGGQNLGVGAGTGAGAPLSELPDGSDTPTIPAGPLPDTRATGFGPATDPVTTAAVLVIMLAGVTSLVVGAQTTKGKHRGKRRRLPVPAAPSPSATSRPRSRPAPATPPSLPKAAPVTPPDLPKAPPVTPSRSLRVVPDKEPRQSRPPHVPRPPIEIRWPDWAKLGWLRPNRAKPGRPAERDAEKHEHTGISS